MHSFWRVYYLIPTLCWSLEDWRSTLVRGYPSYDEAGKILQHFLDTWPDQLSRESIGQSVNGEDIFAYRLFSETTSSSSTQLLLTSMMHAREVVTLPVVLSAMGSLLEAYSVNDEITFLLQNRDLYIVPFVNPDGYMAKEPRRKNSRPTCPSNAQNSGVDLNRNFGWHWTADAINECSEEYGGPAPFSEPETLSLKSLVENHQFVSALNLHSYGNMLTYPNNYNSSVELPPGHAEWYKQSGEVFGFTKVGPAGKILGYTTTGESDDWMYNAMGVLSMSPEIGREQDGFRPDKNRVANIIDQTFSTIKYWMYKSGCELSKLSRDPQGRVSATNTGLSECVGLSGIVQCDGAVSFFENLPNVPKLGFQNSFISICTSTVATVCVIEFGANCRCFEWEQGSSDVSIAFGKIEYGKNQLCNAPPDEQTESWTTPQIHIQNTVQPTVATSEDEHLIAPRIMIFVIFGIVGYFLFLIVRKSFANNIITYERMNEEFALEEIP